MSDAYTDRFKTSALIFMSMGIGVLMGALMTDLGTRGGAIGLGLGYALMGAILYGLLRREEKRAARGVGPNPPDPRTRLIRRRVQIVGGFVVGATLGAVLVSALLGSILAGVSVGIALGLYFAWAIRRELSLRDHEERVQKGQEDGTESGVQTTR